MNKNEFDFTADCKACGGTGSVEGYDDGCPACNGRHDHGTDPAGTVNRLQSAKRGHVRLREYTSPQGYVIIEEMPDRDEDAGGLEGRYGTWEPNDVTTGSMADYQPDTVDQLTNGPLGLNGPYEVYGTTVDAGQMAGGAWPGSPDLSAQQVRDWAKARNDPDTADVFQALIDEPNSPW